MEWKIPTTVIVVAALVIVAAGTIILAVQSSGETVRPGQPDTVTLSTLPTRASPRVTTPAENHATETPPATTTATTAITESSPKKDADKCSIVPDQYGYQYYDPAVYNPETEEKYSLPVRKKDPVITTRQAEEIAIKAFPHYSLDRTEVHISDGWLGVPAYQFDLYEGDRQAVYGYIHADTGEVVTYRIPSRVTSKQGNSNSAVSMDHAQEIAEKEIRERNGEISLKLMDSHVITNSHEDNGKYSFDYKRVIQGFPCVNDGILITSDPGTGEVSDYTKYWFTPENAVAAKTIPTISRDEAIAVVERKARACYPESADSVRIISANLQWMDYIYPDKYTPKPGVIPLGWNVQFDDKTIQNQEYPNPAEAWVDAQNGNLMSFVYFHS